MITLTPTERQEQNRINAAHRFGRYLQDLDQLAVEQFLAHAPDPRAVRERRRELRRLAEQHHRARRYTQAVGWARGGLLDAYGAERAKVAEADGTEPSYGPGATVWEHLCELASLHAASIVVDDLIDDGERMASRIPDCPVALD